VLPRGRRELWGALRLGGFWELEGSRRLVVAL
jgi:hypothetical protein